MAYTILTKSLSRKNNPPAVSIAPSGRISLNKAATEFLNRDHFESVLLMFDEDANKFALRPIKKKDQRAFKVTFGKNGRYAAIAAKSAYDLMGFDYPGTRSFVAQWNDAESAIEIELTEPTQQQTQAKVGFAKRTSRAA